MIDNFAIIISNTSRSLMYLKRLKEEKIYPKKIIYLDDKFPKTIRNNIKKIISKFSKINIKIFHSKNINKKIEKYLLKEKLEYIIYSGYPGIILKNLNLLSKKKLIHSHPGKLPNYKGSTTIYYSILNEKKIYCSTFIMSKNLDNGKLLLIKNYPIPIRIKSIDKSYDDKIRAENMINVIKRRKKLKSKNDKFLPYYIIHPLLRSIVFKNYENNI